METQDDMLDNDSYEENAMKRRKILSALLTDVSLTVGLLIYTLIGAGVFYVIEGDGATHLIDKENKTLTSRHNLIENLWKLSNLTLNTHKENWTAEIDTLLERYDLELYQEYQSGFTPKRPKWNFYTCIFYSITVYTTIGYGVLAPRTTPGRIVTIIYALFGIPLLMLSLARVGERFRKVLLRIWLCMPCRRCNCHKRTKTYNDDKTINPSDDINQNGCEVRKKSSVQFQNGGNRDCDMEIGDSTSTECDEKQTCCKQYGVPLEDKDPPFPLAIFVLLIYLLLGALMFTFWISPDWSFFESFYFVYISLSTIGFGDYVPNVQYEFYVLIVLYLFLGLTLTSMCVNIGMSKFRKGALKTKRMIQRSVRRKRAESNARKAGESVYSTDL